MLASPVDNGGDTSVAYNSGLKSSLPVFPSGSRGALLPGRECRSADLAYREHGDRKQGRLR